MWSFAFCLLSTWHFQVLSVLLACIISTSFPCRAECDFTGGIDHHLAIHSEDDGHLGCFYFLVIMNNVAMRTHT